MIRIDAFGFLATIGADFLTKEVVVDDRVVTMQVRCQVVLFLFLLLINIVPMTNRLCFIFFLYYIFSPI